ncbi:MAG TPA: cytochrome c biogenesis protein CcdA [Candidatus Nitrosotalea sp.]|nr:cytochrome c biogenesis protein CcdA [Candidatus Nitrosotalea sp.]
MTLDNVSLPLALAAGAASFLSPCVLPLVPVYVSYLARTPGRDGAPPATNSLRLNTFASAIAFVTGVSVVIIALFYALRTLLLPVRDVVTPLGGVLVILFALNMAGLLRLPGIDREIRLFKTAPRFTGPLGGFLLGLAFATGWTPCIGPVLGAVLTSGATTGTTAHGLLIVACYCVGLGLPFLVLGLGVDRAVATVRRLSAWRRPIDLASAAVLGAMGVLLLTNSLIVITQIGSRVFPIYNPFGL